ncbi:MAG: nucleotidyl transferase AbiEii/AbiGii toxin family protein [Acidobacteria bacterium]|nr:nucleotidyl transferase AbiEii/AbiGii toxin family protein [Acidobacteriota bacterium]
MELLKALGPATDDFVVVGAQAMKFVLQQARATKDVDFILDVVKLRGEKLSVGARLKELGYAAVEGSRNFQFEKPIPGSKETMRIEFMAPEEFKRDKDFRVDVENGVHARACTGGSIALGESAVHQLSGKLPDGAAFTAPVRVTKPHALVMLKLLALDDRYRNIRGREEARHDREEARIHAADIVAIVSAQREPAQFKKDFELQFQGDPGLGVRVLKIVRGYFRESTSPGLLVYGEFIAADKPLDRSAQREVTQEVERAQKIMLPLLPPKEFYDLLAAAEDSCDIERNAALVGEFLSNLEQTRTAIKEDPAVERLPGMAFGSAYGRGDRFVTSASQALRELPITELQLVRAYLQVCAEKLRGRPELVDRFPHALT